ncbi:5-oxoprolinase subunit PxpA [Robiginitomaculum antarcticum]|uniref:5-oxoprolinase subunit PxpA n=1 Tax=Robiginitomaculum antarcticum TaxID=437507 RepID=UPI000376AD66|nr:5-oxoprolinase subunit PxpA [Robiginitomaculum antarcticum]
MSRQIDLNADLGEAEDAQGRAFEREILSYVSSANLACGGHAGTPEIMAQMCAFAKARGVTIGAHPAYPDRENFGRRSMVLGRDISPDELRRALTTQIVTLCEIAFTAGHPVRHVKPHGALYNDTASQPALARLICETVASIDPKLAVMGFPGGHMEEAAAKSGLRFIGEAFIDRAYMPDGTLVPRSQDGAVLSAQDARMAQMESLVFDRAVRAKDGQIIAIDAASLCLHGDSAGALHTAKAAHVRLIARGVTIAPAA